MPTGRRPITLKAKDDGGTATAAWDESPTQTFVITVTAVNDAPTFTKGADQTVNEDCRRAERRGLGDRDQRGARRTKSGQVVKLHCQQRQQRAVFGAAESWRRMAR
jgi:hypothetical protein